MVRLIGPGCMHINLQPLLQVACQQLANPHLTMGLLPTAASCPWMVWMRPLDEAQEVTREVGQMMRGLCVLMDDISPWILNSDDMCPCRGVHCAAFLVRTSGLPLLCLPPHTPHPSASMNDYA